MKNRFPEEIKCRILNSGEVEAGDFDKKMQNVLRK